MSRIIKFRAWDTNDGVGKMFYLPERETTIRDDPPRLRELKLMQFTGLTDNHKTDYYEDDLISNNLGTDKETIRQVKFIDGCWMLSRIKGNSSLPKNVLVAEIAGLNFPVIGNIYQDSHLLNETDKQSSGV